MKWTKILGIVLLMHLLVISTLLVNPGCKSHSQKSSYPANEEDWEKATLAERPQQTATSYGKSSNPWKTKVETSRSAPTRPIVVERFDSPGEDKNSAFNGIGFEETAPAPLSNISDNETSSQTSSGIVHSVAKGDSLWKIGKQYNVSFDELLAVNTLDRDSILSIGQEIIIPESTGTTVASTLNQDATTEFTHKVVTGDTLSEIAKRYQTTITAIKQNNELKSDTIRIGQLLNIPAKAPPTVIDAEINEVNESVEDIAPLTEEGAHIVRPGETPGEIAKQYNISTEELMAINGIDDPRKLRVGKKLIVDPSKATEPSPVLPEVNLQEPISDFVPPVNPWGNTATAIDDQAAPIIPVLEEETSE